MNDVTHELSASESIEYTNHSKDVLSVLYFHLWPNAYKDETTALANEFYKDGDPKIINLKENEKGLIDSLDFKIDGNKIRWNLLTDTIDIGQLFLEKPLLPGEKITITTPFHVKIPSAMISRLGHLGQAYFITQWFPKPAVYDQNGWNYFSYLNRGEFYSEFGTFDVYITLPENYVVNATGDLTDGEKELHWLDEKVKETQSITTFPKDMSFPTSSDKTKTLHYHQENVHDFAWFADKRWHVLKEEIEMPVSKRKVTGWMMFTNAEADYWMKAPAYVKSSILFFSKWIGEYPYHTISAVDVTEAAGDGMEYPTITTIGSYGDLFETEVTIAHEIGHNWFYGILGSNERIHPWMDEGLTNFLETRYVMEKYSGDKEKQMEQFGKLGNTSKHFGLDRLNHRNIQYIDYLWGARRNSDQPPATTAEKVMRANLHGDVYFKTSVSLDYLKSYLGDSLFDACMHRYFENWKFKHPQPEDLKTIFTSTTGKNLDWFFEDLISTNKKLDYKFSSLKFSKENKNYALTLSNNAGIAAPLSVSSMKDGKVLRTHWLEGFPDTKNITLNDTGADAFRIDAEEKMPELYRTNNTIRTKGIFKKTEPIRFQFLGGLENPDHTQIFFTPVAGWNHYNQFMAGAAFYTMFIPEKKFEYVLMPMYAFGTKDLTGGGNVAYSMYPYQSPVRKIQFSVGVQSYSFGKDEHWERDTTLLSSMLKFGKIDSRIHLYMLPSDRREKISYDAELRNIFIRKDLPYNYNGKPASKNISLFELSFCRDRYNPINPSRQELLVRGNQNLFLATFEEKFRITYKEIDKGFDIRLFAGNIFYRNTTLQGEDYRFQLGGYSGDNDYLFDEVFLGRTDNTGMLAQQFVARDGGFAVPTYFYRQANKWMIAVNLKTSLPGILPVRLFADFGTFDRASELTGGSAISFEAGAELDVIKDIFTIYFPFTYSDDIQYIVDNEKLDYGKLVRFELHLNKLNPFTLLKKIQF
ncbi:MAG: M1 family metallopeptidase [Bacteroidetes bacterium]|nr:M1 family metallopeptidase [Bacteroidota bacterium]